MALSIQGTGNTPMSVAETLRRLEQVGRDLDGVTQRRTMSLSFGDMYNNMYCLTIGQKAEELLERITHTFRRMSLSRRPLAYYLATGIIKDCAMYLDNVWLRRWEKPSLTEVADAMYDRPVARRWRRALAHAKWSVRIHAWRVAFDEIYLQPGNAGALRAEAHFRQCAEREPAKRVKLVE
tara:strand:- start:445 stop:984 length:540 start_codon:yes stop_codon:yes gene_type:complete